MILTDLTDDLADEIFFREINTAFPLQGRQWLRQLAADPLTGIRIRPGLVLDRSVLGFSFRSNDLGFRGPDRVEGRTVIFGTSFAMGYAVDSGDNWYDGLEVAGGALNLGLPVGCQEIANAWRVLHRGERRLAIVVYHPNFWDIAAGYLRWAASGDDIFAFFRWDRSLSGALQKSQERLAAVRRSLGQGMVVADLDGRRLLLNAGYARFNPKAAAAEYRLATDLLRDVLEPFDRVVAFRVPTKEDLAADHLSHGGLAALRDNHRAGWEAFRATVLAPLARCDVIDDIDFDLGDYHPCDTHWNRQGNQRFRAVVGDHLARIGF